jgi:hypothetical protein
MVVDESITVFHRFSAMSEGIVPFTYEFFKLETLP